MKIAPVKRINDLLICSCFAPLNCAAQMNDHFINWVSVSRLSSLLRLLGQMHLFELLLCSCMCVCVCVCVCVVCVCMCVRVCCVHARVGARVRASPSFSENKRRSKKQETL